MPAGLRRYYGTGYFHFITCSCYGRQARLGTARRRDLSLRILEDARKKCRFVFVGYVAMPERLHLLMSEPQVGDPSKAMQVIKQRFAQRVLRRARDEQPCLWATEPEHIWQPRFYDFNGPWSSFRWYRYGEKGLVAVNDTSVMKLRLRN